LIEETIIIPPPSADIPPNPELPPDPVSRERERRRLLASIRANYQRLTRLLIGIALGVIYLAIGVPVFLLTQESMNLVGFFIWTGVYILILMVGSWFIMGRYLAKHNGI